MGRLLAEFAATIQMGILHRHIDRVQQKLHDARHHDLAAFAGKKLLQPVIGKRRIFGIDLANDPDLYFRNVFSLDRAEFMHHFPVMHPYLLQ